MSIHTANVVGSLGFFAMLVKQRKLKFQLSPTYAVRFVPMDFRFVDRIIGQPHSGNSLQLSPPSYAV